MIDEVLSITTKDDGMSGDINNDVRIDVDKQPLSQPEDNSQQVPDEEPASSRTRASKAKEDNQ